MLDFRRGKERYTYKVLQISLREYHKQKRFIKPRSKKLRMRKDKKKKKKKKRWGERVKFLGVTVQNRSIPKRQHGSYVRAVHLLYLYEACNFQIQFLSMTSAGKFRSKRPPPRESFLARFLEEHPLSSELPEPEGRSNSAVPPNIYSVSGKLLYALAGHTIFFL